jgi:hypothetical protein
MTYEVFNDICIAIYYILRYISRINNLGLHTRMTYTYTETEVLLVMIPSLIPLCHALNLAIYSSRITSHDTILLDTTLSMQQILCRHNLQIKRSHTIDCTQIVLVGVGVYLTFFQCIGCIWAGKPR